jgi:hypothetical protein
MPVCAAGGLKVLVCSRPGSDSLCVALALRAASFYFCVNDTYSLDRRLGLCCARSIAKQSARNSEISRGKDACLGYVKRQMAFDASVMFLGLQIAQEKHHSVQGNEGRICIIIS